MAFISDQKRRSGRGQIRRAIFVLAFPVVLSSFLQRAVSIIDIFLVGGLGASAIAAVGISQLMVFFVMALVWGLSVGTTVVIAQAWGAKRFQEAKQTAYQSLLLSIGLALVISTSGILLGPTGLSFFGIAPDVLLLSASYLKIIFIVFTFTVMVNILSGILHGVGNTKTPLAVVTLINLLHIVIAYPLIYGRWGMPSLGIQGAAIAIGLSEGIGALLLLALIFRRGYLHRGPLNPSLSRKVFQVGFPVFGDRIVQNAGQIAYAKLVILYGTAAYAAHQVGLAIEALSFMPGHGFATAASTAVGQSIGASKYNKAKIESWETNRLALFLMAGMGFVFFFFPYLLLRAFTNDPQVIELGTLFLKIVALIQIPLAITMVLSGSLKGAGDTPYILLVTVVGMWIIRIPLAYLFSQHLHLGLLFVWGTMIVDWFVRMTLLIGRYRSERWQGVRL